MSTHADGGARAGSLPEEAARLVEALQQAAARWAPGDASGGAGSRGGDATPDACTCGRAGATRAGDRSDDRSDDRTAGQVPAACRVCPVCQLVARVQQVRPEVVQHLAEAAASLVAALGELTREPPRPSGGSTGRPDVQHIDISD